MRFTRFLLPVMFVLLLGGLAVADGWSLLLSGQFEEARADFTATVQKTPADARARYGLAVLNELEDSPREALEAWRAYYQVEPGGWPALAYWPRVVELARETGRYEHLEAVARRVLAAKEASPELLACARLALADAANRAGKFAAADKEWARMGYLRDWRVIGPFDNVSASGFDKAYPPEQEIIFNATYPGIDDRPLSWMPACIVARDGTCHIGDTLEDENESVFYAVTAIHSPAARPAVIYWDPTGASKLFLNGRLVHVDEMYREAQPLVADPFRVPVELRQGWNTLLVKNASNEYVTAAFRLRVTGPAGEDLTNLQVDAGRAESLRVETAGEAPSPAEPVVVTRLRALLPALDVAAVLGCRLRASGDSEAAEEVLRAALRDAPTCGWLHWELCLTLQEDDEYDEARATRNQVRKYAPRLLAAELDDLESEQSALGAEAYLARLKALVERFPASPRARWALSDAYEEADLTKESLEEARKAVQAAGGPDHLDRLISTYQYNDMHLDADRALANALRAFPHDVSLLSTRANLLVDQQKINEAIAAFNRLMQVDGPYPHYRRQLADLYRGKNDLRQTVAMLEAVHAQCPQSVWDTIRLADTLREVERTEDAIALYRQAIKLDPSRVALREKVQMLTREEPVINLAPAIDAEPILQAAATLQGAPGESARVLLDEARQVIYPDFATLTRCRMIIKVFNQAGVNAFESISLLVQSGWANATVEKARLLKADGKVQDVTDECYGEVCLPSLAPGDIIDVTYRVEDYRPGALARHFWGEWAFSMHDVPVSLSRYVILAPPEVTFTTQEHGPIPPPTVREAQGWRITEWQMTDVPATRAEPYAPGEREVACRLDITTVRSWSDIVAWYRDLAGPRCNPDAAVRAKAAELTKDARTDEEKLRALVAFVSREIRYQTMPFRMSHYTPTPGKQVLRERYGDCKDKAALLSALLAAVEITSDLVLICGNRSESTVPYLPSTRFDHVINRVHLPSGPVWVDATADQMACGLLPTEEQGVPALIIADGITDIILTPMLPVESNGYTADYRVTLAEDGKLSGSITASFVGTWNWMLRSALQHVPESQHDMVLRHAITQVIKNATYESGAIERPDDVEAPLTMRFNFRAEHYAAGAQNLLFVRMPWQGGLEELDSALQDASRTQGIETGLARGIQSNIVHMTLPAGYTPQDLPQQVEATAPWGSYRFTYRLEGNILHAEWRLTLLAARIQPAELSAFHDFIRAIRKESARQVVLKK